MATPVSHPGPPLSTLAAVGAACYHCLALSSNLSSKLQKCSGCHFVSYCNAACQNGSWKSHKPFCRVISSFERVPWMLTMTRWIGENTTEALAQQSTDRHMHCSQQLDRALTTHEKALINFEPRCLFCARTDQLIRIEAAIDPSVAVCPLVPCPTCRLSFACENHWTAAHVEHTQMACDGGHDGLSQCALNQEAAEDDAWAAKMLLRPQHLPEYAQPLRTYRWIPVRLRDAGWASLKSVTWAKKFHAQLEAHFPEAAEEPAVWLRWMSDVLSMPMTVVYALECLNDTLDWTKKDVLTIHLVGAQAKEFFNAICFETILHQLPEVKTLKVTLCGIQLAGLLRRDMHDGPHPIPCCADCTRRGRKRFYEYYDVHYSDLPRRLGSRYSTPDLAIAFNSGASEPHDAEEWESTAALLVARGIPTVFTAYTQDEAHGDNALLLAAGAKLVPELGVCRNPWGSLLPKKDSARLRRFFADNMFLAGGFKGRV
ncbi:hypothetical protein C8R43DRAFT_874009 [Mycena crocata]|nr:hypothetical protein C8R43DRAFT_874009 [Mycena crocata]